MNICYKYTHMYTHICTYKKFEYINIYIHIYIIRKAYIYMYINMETMCPPPGYYTKDLSQLMHLGI